jgi:hypothetical protein
MPLDGNSPLDGHLAGWQALHVASLQQLLWLSQQLPWSSNRKSSQTQVLPWNSVWVLLCAMQIVAKPCRRHDWQ